MGVDVGDGVVHIHIGVDVGVGVIHIFHVGVDVGDGVWVGVYVEVTQQHPMG